MRIVNIENVCNQFHCEVDEIQSYIRVCNTTFAENKRYLSMSYEYAIINLYKSFEKFVLKTMISCLNRNHTHIEQRYNIKLGKHINYDICEFMITKGGYFDFKSRSGLNKTLNEIIGKSHEVSEVLKQPKYAETIEQLCALRNYAAHNSIQAKKAAMKALKTNRISDAGSCLKQQNRLNCISRALLDLASEVCATSPI